MEALKGLELAILLCIGLAGFIVFVTISSEAKKYNNLYSAISALFALLALSSITYNSFLTKWAYIEGSFIWNLIATALVTIGACAFVFGLLYLWVTLSEYIKYKNKARRANMSVKAFKIWKKDTIKALVNDIKTKGNEPPYYNNLLKLYKEEEEKLFASV